ncbi:PadR family transcriptional regulator [Pseudalkalibacillus decolorationis]|uniref:PadR family transcriptional regulator n=1 Tax=Pseudalkalibacillus decolorationis TaxID=163879 RepID=UPI002147DE99|nr:PadR family transcriptional regulator [Pseudalkalibacillus decolorationis]
MNPQFKKGVLTLCVMVMASKKDRYGYELANSISEKFAISEGTVYPVLRRLTKDDYFTTYLKESQEGPPRKYYRLTESGKGEMLELINEWRTFSDGVERIIKEGLTDVEK